MGLLCSGSNHCLASSSHPLHQVGGTPGISLDSVCVHVGLLEQVGVGAVWLFDISFDPAPHILYGIKIWLFSYSLHMTVAIAFKESWCYMSPMQANIVVHEVEVFVNKNFSFSVSWNYFGHQILPEQGNILYKTL